MSNNYVLLERITVGASGASSIVFNNIPQTGYTDLKIVASLRTNRASIIDDMRIKFNGSSSSYTLKRLQGSGTAVTSFSDTTIYFNGTGGNATANTFGNTEIYIPNYTSSNYKSVSIDAVTENNASNAYQDFDAALWSSTAAITSIAIDSWNSATIQQYSTFSLYALAAVGTTPTIAPYASGGDIIQTDGTYWYHAFINSGSFVPAKTLSADVLVVAGGGGGGSYAGGGGGAGGLLAFTAQALAGNTVYSATVGAGGAGGVINYPGSNGGNSVFAALTTAIGGGGGAGNAGNATSGGSGGGAEAGITGTTAGGAGTSGQGNAGGSASTDNATYRFGGGGGGAGAAGGNSGTSSSGTPGVGGIGATSATINAMGAATGLGQYSSPNYYFAGGGAGSGQGKNQVGGLGGGGTDGIYNGQAATAGTPNTGGGGGGHEYNSPGAAGGSGVVIIRYLV